jgi:hypothetical protein
MTTANCTDIQKAYIAGDTKRVAFTICDTATGEGFRPDTLVMTIYDVYPVGLGATRTVYLVAGQKTDIAVASAIVNSQEAVDVLSACSVTGDVELYLTPEDTALEVPAIILHTPHQRRILFTWTWDSPTKTQSHQIIFRLYPNRASVAT